MILEKTFEKNRAVCMAHVYYGDPSEGFSVKEIKALCESGVDIVEFGIPFSDPTADGLVFQRACERALKAGMTPEKAIKGIRKLRRAGIKQPIVVTSYYNIIFQIGIEEFVKKIKRAGANALIVPDLPLEESSSLLGEGKKQGIKIILLVAPTTQKKRLKKILKQAQGFVYLVSVTGVTGSRESMQTKTLERINQIKKHSKIPILVGFGISKPQHAKAVIEAGANGVIIGSAIGRIYEKMLGSPEKSLAEIRKFAMKIKKSCRESVK